MAAEAHFHDCDWWNNGLCNCAERTSYSPFTPTPTDTIRLSAKGVTVREVTVDADGPLMPYYYACGANYCDDPACVSNQPDSPNYFPHPEVL